MDPDRVTRVDRHNTTGAGNLIARSDTKYDPRGRVWRTIRYEVNPSTGTVGGSQADNFWFDAAGNLIERQPSGLMNGLELTYDSLGRLVKQTDPLGAETDYTYDAANNRKTLTDGENNTTTWGYDGIGRVVKETNPLSSSRTFTYDATGSLATRTDRLGRVIEFEYDDAGRATVERWKTGATTVKTIQVTYDADGRVATAGDNQSSYAYQYDLNGAMTELDNNGTPDMPRVVLTSAYNQLAERTSLAAEFATTNDFLNSYGYDKLGRTASTNQQSNGGNTVASKRVTFGYEVRGGYSAINRYAALSNTNLVATSTYGYDDFARLTSLQHTKGATSLATHAYSFNAARLIDQHVTVDGDSDYTYDSDTQVTEADHTFQTDETFSYDLTGNRTNSGYSTGAGNRLLSDGTFDYEYDAEGNRTKRTTISTSAFVESAWDHRNRLTKVTFKTSLGVKTKEVQYVYDVTDQRIGKLLDSNGDGTIDAEWWYACDSMVKGKLSDIVLVFDGAGALRNRFLHGPDADQSLAGEEAGGDVLWPLADHLGTIRDLAEYDSGTDTTSVANHLKYNVFGQITSQSNSALTPLYAFTGREWDGDTGLFYYRARWYDAGVGRFLSEDPIGFGAGDANLSRYAVNSPVINTDASGLTVIDWRMGLWALRLAPLLGVSIGVILALIALGLTIDLIIKMLRRRPVEKFGCDIGECLTNAPCGMIYPDGYATRMCQFRTIIAPLPGCPQTPIGAQICTCGPNDE